MSHIICNSLIYSTEIRYFKFTGTHTQDPRTLLDEKHFGDDILDTGNHQLNFFGTFCEVSDISNRLHASFFPSLFGDFFRIFFKILPPASF